jgi:hypothetical protein
MFFWGIQASWFLPLIDKGGLVLTQLGGSGGRNSFQSSFQIISLDHPDISAIFNGRPIEAKILLLSGHYKDFRWSFRL